MEMESIHCSRVHTPVPSVMINARLQAARDAEDSDQRLRAFGQHLEFQLSAYYTALKESGTNSTARIDTAIKELIFQLDSDVRKVRKDEADSAKVLAITMDRVVSHLAEFSFTDPRAESDDDCDNWAMAASPVSALCGEMPADQLAAGVRATWRRYLRSNSAEDFPSLDPDEVAAATGAPPGSATAATAVPHLAATDLLLGQLYARWEAAFALVACLDCTENAGQGALLRMAYVDLLTVTARQLQCYPPQAPRLPGVEEERLRGAGSCEAYRVASLEELTENLLFISQVWWWWTTKALAVKAQVAQLAAAQLGAPPPPMGHDTPIPDDAGFTVGGGRCSGGGGGGYALAASPPQHEYPPELLLGDTASAYDAFIPQWQRRIEEAEEAAAAVVACVLRESHVIAAAVLRVDIERALVAPPEDPDAAAEAMDTVQVDCRVITRAATFFLEALPADFYASGIAPPQRFPDGAAAADGFLRAVLRDALRPIAEAALEHAEEWFAPQAAVPNPLGASPRKAALREVLALVERYWGAEAARQDDILQTLRRLSE